MNWNIADLVHPDPQRFDNPPPPTYTARVPFSIDVPVGNGLLPDCEGTAVIVGSALEGWKYSSIELHLFHHARDFGAAFGDEPLEVADPGKDAPPAMRAAYHAAWALRASIIATLEADRGHAEECSRALEEAEQEEINAERERAASWRAAE